MKKEKIEKLNLKEVINEFPAIYNKLNYKKKEFDRMNFMRMTVSKFYRSKTTVCEYPIKPISKLI